MHVAVNVNGRIVREQDAVISVLDNGFLFGDGVYEVMRTYRRRPFLFAAHQRRLRRSAERLSIALRHEDDEVLDRVRATIDALNGTGEVYVRIVVTRGVGEMSYDPLTCPTPTLVVIARPLEPPAPAVYERGVTISLVSIVRNATDALDPAIKSNNLLNNILAMQEALRRNAFEALMRNHRGEIVECAQSNIFVVRGGEVLTPPLEGGLLAGVTRAFVVELAQAESLPVQEVTLREDDLATADEAFLTSTTREIVPVVAIDDRVVGSGQPGAVTRALSSAFHRHTSAL
jgi:branched-chain amino acid aminotransferase